MRRFLTHKNDPSDASSKGFNEGLRAHRPDDSKSYDTPTSASDREGCFGSAVNLDQSPLPEDTQVVSVVGDHGAP